MQLLDKLIGLTLQEVKVFFAQSGITDYDIVYYTDRKQRYFDTDIVVKATFDQNKYTVLVCPMQMDIPQEE